MRNVSVDHNLAVAKGVGGVAQGGGIWSSDLLSAPPVELTLTNSKVTDNVLNASPGVTAQGGGIFATTLVTLNHSVVAHNFPDQLLWVRCRAGCCQARDERRAPPVYGARTAAALGVANPGWPLTRIGIHVHGCLRVLGLVDVDDHHLLGAR